MEFKAAKCPNCSGALQVPDDRTTVKCMYCGVDVIVRDAIQLSAGKAKEFTEASIAKAAIPDKTAAMAYIGCGSMAGVVGVIILAASVKELGLFALIFIIPGIVLLLVGSKTLGKYKEVIAGYRGLCPYCASLVTLPYHAPGADCPACEKRIVIRDNKFFSVDTPVSGLPGSK